MKKYLIVFITIIVLAGAGYVIYDYFYAPAEESGVSPSPWVGGDRDAHGCIGSAGYSWCEAKQKCLRVWEESCDSAQDAAAIKQVFAKKYNKKFSDISVEISLGTGTHAKGSVKFLMDGQAGEGGLFWAYKKDGQWQLAFDGNGIVACEVLKPYNFPESMTEGICAN